MRAAVFPRPEASEVMEREDLLPGEGEVVVRVEACGVCGTDAHIYRGEFPARFPLVAGHEFAGVVERTGPGVASLRVGAASAGRAGAAWCICAATCSPTA